MSSLPNRTQLVEDLYDLARDHPGEERVAVLINLADTRVLSETQRALGPRFVDDLVHFAKRAIQSALRDSIVLYHVGTTDFALILPAEEPALSGNLGRIGSALSGIVESRGVPALAQAAIGLAPFRLGETQPLDVLRTAYGAALDAREAELDIEAHSPLKDEQHRRRFDLLAGISQALLATDQFSLVYQPRIEMRTGGCVAAEALLRWRHPNLGEVLAAEFIPLVEQTALSGPMTDWVLETAFKQAADWRRAGLEMPISVNVSAANLEDQDFPQRLAAALERHDLPPGMIELEFTETALIRHRARVLEHLAAIKALGVSCAIDDFGTGYSSFSYLQDISVDVIKIDRSFMRSLERERDRKLLKAMVRLAHDLKYRVVAEGVETQIAYDVVRQAGCDEVQGFFISRPLSPSAFLKWLAAGGTFAGESRAA